MIAKFLVLFQARFQLIRFFFSIFFCLLLGGLVSFGFVSK